MSVGVVLTCRRLAAAAGALSRTVLPVAVLLASRASVASVMAPNSSRPPASVAPASFRIHNLMPDFWKFWAAAQGQPVARQAKLWQALYVKPHRRLFDDLAPACKEEYAPAWARANYFPNLAGIVPGMRAADSGLPRKLSAARQRFLRMFPDMRWSGDVYLMASAYCFNGRAQIIAGHEAILLGIDTRVALGQKDPIPDMTHELFHRYHYQFFDFKPSSGYPLWTTLWAEGMALYVAERLNPHASDADLSLFPIGMPGRVDGRRQELAADFLKSFSATDEADARKWFNDDNSKDPVIPARAGYELGALVVRQIARRYSIQTMAHWSRGQAQPRIRAALRSIAQTRD